MFELPMRQIIEENMKEVMVRSLILSPFSSALPVSDIATGDAKAVALLQKQL